MSKGEELFAFHVRAHKLPEPVREFKFLPDRRFRFDFAWPEFRLAVEIEGGTWSGGRHTRGKGYAADLEKYNLAVKEGWAVLRFTTDMVNDGTAVMAVIGCLHR